MSKRKQDYLIAPAGQNPSPQILARLKVHIDRDPDASIVKERHAHVVATMSDDAVARLSGEFGTQLIIELDTKLTY